MNQYYVYIMTNPSRTLYTGVTNNLEIRTWQHKSGEIPGFTSKYKITRLVYFETTNDIISAIAREKKIKGWSRKKKLELIKTINPNFEDLSGEWLNT